VTFPAGSAARLAAGVFGLSALLLAACAGKQAAAPPPPGAPAVLSPTTEALPEVEPWSFQGHSGLMIRTRWYRLFTTTSDADLLGEMPAFLERALDRYTSEFGPLPRPPMKLDTFLLGDRPQWEVLTRQAMGQQAPVYLKIERGGFASGGRAMLWPIGPRDTLAIAAHEGWHQYTQRTFKEELPVWLEEGIGTYMEGLAPDPLDPSRYVLSPWSNPERLEQLRKASEQGELLPLGKLLEATPQDLIERGTDAALTYYAQVWGLAHFLKEGEGGKYASGLHSLLMAAASGRLKAELAPLFGAQAAERSMSERRGAEAYKAYFDVDLARASAQYTAFISHVTQAGGG
jgi:Protein of unknown function (DUF1570)